MNEWIFYLELEFIELLKLIQQILMIVWFVLIIFIINEMKIMIKEIKEIKNIKLKEREIDVATKLADTKAKRMKELKWRTKFYNFDDLE